MYGSWWLVILDFKLAEMLGLSAFLNNGDISILSVWPKVIRPKSNTLSKFAVKSSLLKGSSLYQLFEIL